MGLRALVLLALAVSGHVGATPFEAHPPNELSLQQGLLLIGAVGTGDQPLRDAYLHGVAEIAWPGGSLVACPREDRGDVVEALRALESDCPGARNFLAARVSAGPGTHVQWVGDVALPTPPSASMVLPASRGGAVTWAAVLSAHWMEWRFTDNQRFAPASSGASLRVDHEGGTTWFNGTQWLFMHEGAHASVRADGLLGTFPAPVRVVLGPTDAEAVRTLADPFVLLALQERALGPEEREPRANATALLRTHGRIPHQVNGAVVGHWNGTLDGRPMERGIALVRVRSLAGTIGDDGFSGDLEADLQVRSSRVAVGGGGVTGPPWVLATVLWVVAAAALAIRRHAVPVVGARRAVRFSAWVVGLLVVDLLVMRRVLGTSFLTGWGTEGAGALLALATFEAVATAWTWLLLHQPVRVLLAKGLPGPARVWGDGAAALWWLLLLGVWPAMVLASGLTWARL